MHPAARRARIEAISKTLVHVSAIVVATSAFFLFTSQPVDWRFGIGVVLGAVMYLLAELLIPFYVDTKPD